MPSPSTHCGRVRHMVRLFRVRNRLFPTVPFAQRFPGLLSAVKTVVAVRWRPCRQNREGFPARAAPSPANPDAVVALIMRLLAPSAVTYDRPIPAYGTPPRQQFQWERGHPGSTLFSFSGSAIKRIKAGVKAALERPAKARSSCGTSPSGKVNFERKKEYRFRTRGAVSRL